MRVIHFEVDSNEIQIVPLADWHIGSEECDIELIKETTDYIARTPNCYAILNGDLCNFTTRLSVGSLFEETMTPQNQVVTAAYYLQEIAKQKKIISMVSGNHENRTNKDTGLSLTDLLLAHLLKYDETLNDRYCQDGAYTFLTLDGRNGNKNRFPVAFTIFNLHGNGGGTKIGNKIQRLDDMSQIVPAHLYIRSHTHQPETHRGIFYDVNTNLHTVKEQPCVFVNTGSMLKYGGYGARAGMKPLSRGIPLITLKVKRQAYKGKENYLRSVECVIKDHLGE